MAKPKSLAFGVVGYPIGHSLSPLLHEFLLEAIQLNGRFELFEIPPQQFEEKIRALKAGGIRGFSVTIPFKEQIISLLDELDERAQRAGAVNVVLHEKNRLLGFNTDGTGFERALAFHNLEVSKKQALILGAGGAARAVAAALIRGGIRKIYLANRTTVRALELVEHLSSASGFFNFITVNLQHAEILKLLESVDFVINATPVGMWPDSAAAPFEFPKTDDNLIAIDLIYNPLPTRFLRSASAAGLAVMDGLDMLIFQGIAAMRIWSGREIDANSVYPHLRKLLIEKLKNYEPA